MMIFNGKNMMCCGGDYVLAAGLISVGTAIRAPPSSHPRKIQKLQFIVVVSFDVIFPLIRG